MFCWKCLSLFRFMKCGIADIISTNRTEWPRCIWIHFSREDTKTVLAWPRHRIHDACVCLWTDIWTLAVGCGMVEFAWEMISGKTNNNKRHKIPQTLNWSDNYKPSGLLNPICWPSSHTSPICSYWRKTSLHLGNNFTQVNEDGHRLCQDTHSAEQQENRSRSL